jgi:hypothetical protein
MGKLQLKILLWLAAVFLAACSTADVFEVSCSNGQG